MKIATVIIMLIFFVFALGVGGWFLYTNNQTVGNSSKQTASSGFVPGIGGGPDEGTQSSLFSQNRAKLQTLLTQHGVYASNYLEDIYDGKASDDSRELLQGNTSALATLFAEMGGSRDDFLTMWDGHIQEYENYTLALKRNDRNGTAQARAALSMHAQAMGRMAQMVSPNLSEERVRQLMEDHIDLSLGIIETHARGDSSQKTKLMADASNQAVKFANTLSNGIETKSR